MGSPVLPSVVVKPRAGIGHTGYVRKEAARVDPLRVIAGPRRLQILVMVWDHELSAGQIAAGFDVSWGAVSQHITVLRKAGFLLERRQGTSRLYRADKDALGALRAVVEEKWRTTLPSTSSGWAATRRSTRYRAGHTESACARAWRRPGSSSRSTHRTGLVFTSGWQGDEVVSPGSTRVEITLTSAGLGTDVLLRHLGLPGDAQRAHHRQPGPDPNAEQPIVGV